jgi:hypothetical protein
MAKQPTPYEQGRADGVWTRSRVAEHGFSSVAECLAHYEATYDATVARLRASNNPDEAARQIEYWNGLIGAVRESLGALMVQEGA